MDLSIDDDPLLYNVTICMRKNDRLVMIVVTTIVNAHLHRFSSVFVYESTKQVS